MIKFYSFRGIITMISEYNIGAAEENGCYQLISVRNEVGDITNFVVSPTTFFVDQEIVSIGDEVTGYYDGNAPAILIYPPQYPALIMVKEKPYQNVKVDYFDHQLVSSDGYLKIYIAPNTQRRLTNGQIFSGNPANRNLIVIYGATTRSIPAQTTPYKIIVWCNKQ